MVKLATFGILCLLALLVSLCTKGEGRTLRVAASVLAVNWLLFAMPWIYAPLAPSFIVSSAGVRVSNLDMWALADLISLMVIGWHGRFIWWSPMLWSIYLVTLCMYSIAWALELQYVEYKYVLDGALIVQIAIILAMGGGGCADYLLDRWRRLRLLAMVNSGADKAPQGRVAGS